MGLGDELSNEVDRIKVSLKLQNKALAKELRGATEERADNISELSSDIKTILDKMAYVTDNKMTRINDRVQEHIYQTEAISLIIIMDQLDKKVQELAGIKQQIKQLKAKIPKLSDKCSKFYTCYECLQDESCGWCSMEDKCVEGDEKGPQKISCNFYSYKQCNGRQCHKYNTCATCIADPSCGWCIDDNRYMSGCLQQPYDYQGCPRNGWFHLESRQNSCPQQLRKVYEEEFDENSYWSKPLEDSAYIDEEESNEQDKNNALNGRGGVEESESNTEYNKKQQQVVSQIKQLEALVKEIEKEIEALQKRYQETVEWLDKFNKGEEGEGEQQQQQEEEQQQEQQEETQSTQNEAQKKKEEKAKKKEEKKQNDQESKKKKEEEKKKKAEEEKKKKEEEQKKKDEERKKKKQEEDEKKKKRKEEEDAKRKKLQEDLDKKKQEEEQNEEARDSNEQEQQQEDGDAEGNHGDADNNESNNASHSDETNQETAQEGDDQSDQSQKKSKKSSKGGDSKNKAKDKQGSKDKESEQGDEQGNEEKEEDKREIPDSYFREPQLQNKKWEDFYNGNFNFIAQEQEVDDDEMQFDSIDIVDEFYDPFHLN
ncbi:unnamed protein product (macronuclear) [Paramecium tetraurelia]|uniref:PSI domain-containing protein n=1 Tax=Paramecium tetraurelia TaxID=5888 RepID=A0CM42_PARTE|nr:uncharacterized protein GSPATT00008338001 [Paramecium tetraurelia]CAK71859.1 unnamed protein product [Paramecium tetraurelia]|eukprot:XP_001439256.1 hypothetical protein (macronuclear) [Paramecium tetraurelia strain d4-2]